MKKSGNTSYNYNTPQQNRATAKPTYESPLISTANASPELSKKSYIQAKQEAKKSDEIEAEDATWGFCISSRKKQEQEAVY